MLTTKVTKKNESQQTNAQPNFRNIEISEYRIFKSPKNPLSDLSDQSDQSDSSDKKLVDPLTRWLVDLLTC